jgi:uncharacterized protein
MEGEPNHEDVKFVETVVAFLVESPESVRVARSTDEMGVLITLDVAPNDMGKILGRGGGTAKAIRTLLRIVGSKHNARVALKINEPAGGFNTYKNTKSLDEALDDIGY